MHHQLHQTVALRLLHRWLHVVVAAVEVSTTLQVQMVDLQVVVLQTVGKVHNLQLRQRRQLKETMVAQNSLVVSAVAVAVAQDQLVVTEAQTLEATVVVDVPVTLI